MSTDAHAVNTPNTRKRSRAAAMQATDPAAPNQTVQQPTTDDGFVIDNDAVESGGDDDDDVEGGKPDKKAGRRKIKIEFIQDKSRRHITFSKRKAGIMKKAYELSTLTGTQVLLLVVSETGLVYTFTTAKLQPLVTQPEGKNLIQACLNAPHGALPSNMPVGAPIGRSAPQQMQTPSAQQQPPPSGPMPGMPPPMGTQPRNVPGGLAIGNAPAGGQGDDAEVDRDAHDDADAEGEKRGAARRRTSGAGKGNANANNVQGAAGGGRSPTTPSTHAGGPAQQAMPMGQPPYGATPGSAGQDGATGYPGGPPPPGGAYPQHGVHPMMGTAPGYYPAPGMAGAWGTPHGGPPPQNAYGRR